MMMTMVVVVVVVLIMMLDFERHHSQYVTIDTKHHELAKHVHAR